MEPIYIFGHKNPDTDSIVSAMAYAELQHSIGNRQYEASRLGPVSDETQMVLDRFGFEPPRLLYDVRTQLRDLNYDTPPALDSGVTMNRAWQELHGDPKILALPITTDGGQLHGMLSRGDIATFDMYSIDHPVADQIPVFNMLASLEGRILNDTRNVFDSLSGEVIIALPLPEGGKSTICSSSIVICGEQPDVVERAINMGANCVIICQAQLSERFRNIDSSTCIIATPYDSYRAARMIYQSIPVSRVCNNEGLVSFHLTDYVDDVKEQMLLSRYRSYPILDESERVVGTISRFHLIKPSRKRVVLVDHNEASQSVSGLEQAEILEIIDHHRLADVQTSAPIYFRNEPVGATSTIIGSMFQDKGLMPSPPLAGLICAAIISDTVMFKSPTCTERDRRMAERMARISGESIDELGYRIFNQSTAEGKPARDLIFSDFKEFHIAGQTLGIGQVTCMDSARVLQRMPEFLEIMEDAKQKAGYDMMLLMLTDVLREGTELIYLGDDTTINQAFNVQAKDHHVFLPKIVSRKKQIVPMLSLLWG